ncbi:MAG TPA: fibronectin type III domain-containing protein [Vitreimonas sp.]|nr:fibronectin type III domain-containing protein [Vitreimonas sp.]
MSKSLLTFSVITLSLLGLLTVATTPVAAQVMVQEQTMEANTSSNASVTCEGNCNGSAEANSSVTGRQYQRMEVSGNAGTTYVARPARRYVKTKTKYVHSRAATPVVWVSEGAVRLTWSLRGGTCHVRYTEASEAVYKYATAASCDDGGVTISGLTPGIRYRFQVRQNDGGWSGSVIVKAQ